MSFNVINTYQTFSGSTGKPRSAGFVTFYKNTTTTLAQIFSDEALTVPQDNPYQLDAHGRITGDVKYSGLLTLKITNEDLSDVRTDDNVATTASTINSDLRYGPIFETVAAMSQATPVDINGVSVDLVAGMTVSTQGYYAAGDGGEATYLIVAPQAFDWHGDHELANSNIAVLQVGGEVDVKQYGLRAGSSFDNTAAWNALTASGVLEITGLSGAFYFDSAPAQITSSITIKGYGREKSRLIKNFSTGILLDFSTTAYIVIDGVSIEAGVAQTAGSFIKTIGIRSDITNCFFLNHFVGVDSNTTIYNIDNCEFRDGVGGAGSCGILVAGSPVEVRISKIVMDTGETPRPDYGIWVQGVDAMHITSCDIINCGKDLFINPQNAEVATSIKVLDTYFDTATRGVSIEPNAGGSVQFIQFIGCWTSGHTDSGFVIAPASTGRVDGVELIGHQAMLNGGSGILMDGGTDTDNVRILGGAIGGNTLRGVFVAADVSNFSIKDVIIGPSNLQVGNTLEGILIDTGASNNFDIEGNDLRGNGASFTDLSSGTTGRRVVANKGFNDTAVGSSISVGASPFTYTAGDSPETVYLLSGTVSGVIQAGQTIGTTDFSVQLEPLESIQVTYSGAPFMNKVRH